jgi:hypothetical protein
LQEGKADLLLILDQSTNVGDMIIIFREIQHQHTVTRMLKLTSLVIVPLNETPSTPAASSAADAFPTQSIVVETTLYCAWRPRSWISRVWIESQAPWLPV